VQNEKRFKQKIESARRLEKKKVTLDVMEKGGRTHSQSEVALSLRNTFQTKELKEA